MERGILLEVRGRQGILLTGTGEFRRVDLAVGRWQVGEEIAAPLARAGRPWLRTVVAVAAAALVLFGGPAGYWQWSLLQPSVVLAMEINPTLEFTINGKGTVIDARGLNADGVELLNGMNWRKLPVADVVQAATNKAVAMGKLDPASVEGAIVITAAPVKGEAISDERAQAITQSAQVAAETAVKAAAVAQGKKPEAQVATTPTTKTEVEEARSEGLTLPEYVLYKKVQETHPEVTVTPETFQHKGPGAVLKDLGILPSEVLPSINKGRGKDDGADHKKSDEKDRNQGKGDQKGDEKPSTQGQKPDDHSNGGASDKPGKDKATDEHSDSSSNKGGQGSDSRSGVGLPGVSLKPDSKPDSSDHGQGSGQSKGDEKGNNKSDEKSPDKGKEKDKGKSGKDH